MDAGECGLLLVSADTIARHDREDSGAQCFGTDDAARRRRQAEQRIARERELRACGRYFNRLEA